MSIEPTERYDSEQFESSRREMFDYIVHLEDTLEQAEKLGSNGDPDMFLLLKSIENADEELVLYAKESNESVPIKKYSQSIENLKVKFLPKIVTEMVKLLKEGKKAQEEMNELIDIISYYNEEYPELGLADILSST